MKLGFSDISKLFVLTRWLSPNEPTQNRESNQRRYASLLSHIMKWKHGLRLMMIELITLVKLITVSFKILYPIFVTLCRDFNLTTRLFQSLIVNISIPPMALYLCGITRIRTWISHSLMYVVITHPIPKLIPDQIPLNPTALCLLCC